MSVSNEDIARLFENMGTLLEMKGDSVFKVRAYQRAARTIDQLSFSLAQAVAEIVVMGGAVNVPGNVSPVASANLYEDPEAAAIVYSSGAPLVQVGLDVCNEVSISRSQLERIQGAGTPTTQLLAAATPFLRKSYADRGLLGQADGVRYNDVPAVAFAVDPDLFHCTDFYVEIETHSPVTRGQTVAHRQVPEGNSPNVRVCLKVEGRQLAEMFTDRIVDYRRP